MFFFFLVVLPVLVFLPEVPKRLEDIRKNYKSIGYIIITTPVLIGTATFAIWLSDLIPILKWGLLGSNIAVAPASDSVTAIQNSSQEIPIWNLIQFSVFIIVLVAAITLFNYIEELEYRDSYKSVVVWALLHLFMGIPLFAVIPIFSVGIIYKMIKDRKGLGPAYVAHLFTNMVLVSILILLAISAL